MAAETHETKPVIKIKDISEELEQEIISIAKYALDKMHTNQEIASHLKDELNRKYNGNWQCFVGRSFGSFVTYEAKHYMYFYIGQYAFLIFKTFKTS
jgi:dynein light chain LC8-type